MKVAEGRGDRQRAWRHLVDRMAARTIGDDKVFSALLGRRDGQGRVGKGKGGGKAGQKLSHHALCPLVRNFPPTFPWFESTPLIWVNNGLHRLVRPRFDTAQKQNRPAMPCCSLVQRRTAMPAD